MPTTATPPGPVGTDLAVFQALLVFVKVVNFLTFSNVALVERFRAGFFRDAADRRAGVPLRAALREVWGRALGALAIASRCKIRRPRRWIFSTITFELLAGLGLRLYFDFCGCECYDEGENAWRLHAAAKCHRTTASTALYL